ncbi:MAG: chemotaxis protein CheW [Nitrospiraceae bacterium]
MLRSQNHDHRRTGHKAVGSPRNQALLVFWVGGRRLAARMEDIAGVQVWQHATPVPSDTPFVNAMIRFDTECMPVYDLATKLNQRLDSDSPLCLMIKHEDGPMAICIDAHIPSLRVVDPSTIQGGDNGDADIAGVCSAGDEQVLIINCAKLGKDAVFSFGRSRS